MIWYKKNSSLLFSFLLMLAGQSLIAHDEFESIEDDFSIDIFDDADINNVLDSTNFAIKRTINPQTAMELLNMLLVPNVLQNNFYIHTWVLNSRDTLDLPIFLADTLDNTRRWDGGWHLFADYTARMNYTTHHSTIDHYLALSNDDIIDAIMKAVEQAQKITNVPINPTDVFPLFSGGKVQERRAGFMFHLMRHYHNLTWYLYVPFYWRERNYFLTDEERDAIEAEFDATSQEQQHDFAQNNLISDRLGFGDTRFAIEFPIYRRPQFIARLGFQTTVPTAFSLIKGIFGSTFKNRSVNQPTIDLAKLIDLSTNPDTIPEAAAIGKDFFLGAIDRLSAILLDTGLGNNKHFGLGIFVLTKSSLGSFIHRPWAQAITLKGKISAEYLFPAREKRYFIEKNVQALFAQHDFENTADPAVAAENLAFLEQQTVNRFYPYVFEALVHPGIVLIWTSKMVYKKNRWILELGSDSWFKTGEWLTNIDAPNDLKQRLDISNARRIWAYQGSVFATIMYKIPRPNNEWKISLHVSSTLTTYGIGDEFIISLALEKNF